MNGEAISCSLCQDRISSQDECLKERGRVICPQCQRSLASVVELSSGFKTAVNVKDDLRNRNEEKVRAYIPTEKGAEVLENMAENLHPSANRRARLIAGTYGTGKSHLALVLANFLLRPPGDPALAPILEKIENKWPEKGKKIQGYRQSIPKPFLVVLLEGYEGQINEALLVALERALKTEELRDILPKTVFHAAVQRIEAWRQKHPEAYQAFERLVLENGLVSVQSFEERLKAYERFAYETFRRLHPQVAFGADFRPHSLFKAKEVYREVADRLVREHDKGGILVIWDEAGRYLEQVVDDLEGNEYGELQSFAEGCDSSGSAQVHLYLISHRTIAEYGKIRRLSLPGQREKLEGDLKKVAGRFREIVMTSQDEEVFSLIDRVILHRHEKPEWKGLVEENRDWFDELTHRAFDLKIFPNLTLEEIREILVVGSYPLHPVTAFCLPLLSGKVAQNERTLFTFLSDSGQDTLGRYLIRTDLPLKGQNPPSFTVDGLMDYFLLQMKEAPKYEGTPAVAREYERSDSRIPPGNVLARRLLRALAVILAIDSNQLRATPETLEYALNLRGMEREKLQEVLKALSSGSDKVLIHSRHQGTYRFFGGGGSEIDLEEEIEKVIKERGPFVDPIAHMKKIWKELDLPRSLDPQVYNDDYKINRCFWLDYVSLREMENPNRWLSNLSQGDFCDGYAVVILPQTEGEIQKAIRQAEGGLNHLQILVGVPRKPLPCLSWLYRHEALDHLAARHPDLYGAGQPLREEWEHYQGECLALLQASLMPLTDPKENLLDWYAGGQPVPNITTVGKLSQLASERMERVFSLTPAIPHKDLIERDRDTQAKYRLPVIDKIFKANGPQELAEEVNQPVKMLRMAILDNNGLLRCEQGKWKIEKPIEGSKYQAMIRLWEAIDAFVQEARVSRKPFAGLIRQLRCPPFGLRLRTIPVILAAVLRQYVLKSNLAIGFHQTTHQVENVDPINGETIENIVKNPEKYDLKFIEIGENQATILLALLREVFHDSVTLLPGLPEDGLTALKTAIVQWWQRLPQQARLTSDLSELFQKMRDEVFHPLSQEGANVHDLLLGKLPELSGINHLGYASASEVAERVVQAVGQFRKEMEGCTERLTERVAGKVKGVFGLDENAAMEETLAGVGRWYESLPEEKRNYLFGGDSVALLRWARDLQENPDPQSALASLAGSLTGHPIDGWKDGQVDFFAGKLTGARENIEKFEPPSPLPPPPPGSGPDTARPPDPPDTLPGFIRLKIVLGGKVIERTFDEVAELSQIGRGLKNTLKATLENMGDSLSPQERLTILTSLLQEHLS